MLMSAVIVTNRTLLYQLIPSFIKVTYKHTLHDQ